MKQQLLPAGFDSMSLSCSLLGFLHSNFSLRGNTLSSGSTCSGCFCCQLALVSERGFFASRYTRLKLAFGDILHCKQTWVFLLQTRGEIVFVVRTCVIIQETFKQHERAKSKLSELENFANVASGKRKIERNK